MDVHKCSRKILIFKEFQKLGLRTHCILFSWKMTWHNGKRGRNSNYRVPHLHCNAVNVLVKCYDHLKSVTQNRVSGWCFWFVCCAVLCRAVLWCPAQRTTLHFFPSSSSKGGCFLFCFFFEEPWCLDLEGEACCDPPWVRRTGFLWVFWFSPTCFRPEKGSHHVCSGNYTPLSFSVSTVHFYLWMNMVSMGSRTFCSLVIVATASRSSTAAALSLLEVALFNC